MLVVPGFRGCGQGPGKLGLSFPKWWWKPQTLWWLGFMCHVPRALSFCKAHCKGCASLQTLLLPIMGSSGFGNELGRLCQSLFLSATVDKLSNLLRAYNKIYVSSLRCTADMPIALQLAA